MLPDIRYFAFYGVNKEMIVLLDVKFFLIHELWNKDARTRINPKNAACCKRTHGPIRSAAQSQLTVHTQLPYCDKL